MMENKNLVKASDFFYESGKFAWLKGTPKDIACYNVWRAVRRPFLIPKSVCTHQGKIFCGHGAHGKPCTGHKKEALQDTSSRDARGDHETAVGRSSDLLRGTIYARKSLPSFCRASYESSWEVFEANLAGCLMCGEVHVCFDGVCPVELNKEGHSVCVITGLCVKMLSFSNEEFLDTIHVVDDLQSGRLAPQTQQASKCLLPSSAVAFASLPQGMATGKKRCREDYEHERPLMHNASATVSFVVADTHTTLPAHLSPSGLLHASSLNPPSSSSCTSSMMRCSVNKKNRYRSWVYHRVMQPSPDMMGPSHRGVASSSAPSLTRAAALAAALAPSSSSSSAWQPHGATAHAPPTVGAAGSGHNFVHPMMMMMPSKDNAGGTSRCHRNGATRNGAIRRRGVLPALFPSAGPSSSSSAASSIPTLPGYAAWGGRLAEASGFDSNVCFSSSRASADGGAACVASSSSSSLCSGGLLGVEGAMPATTSSDHMRSMIHSFVYDVLCSSKWEKSINMERQKASAKKKHAMTQQRLLSVGSTNTNSNNTQSYCKLVRQSFSAGRMANAHMATKTERQRICEWCVDMIHRHMCLMNTMCKGVITEAKLRSAAIGLLYMLRQGIIVHDLVVLPRLRRLEDILPLENHLEVIFGVRAKCITETENVVKIILRSVTKQQLLDAGVSEVSCRLM